MSRENSANLLPLTNSIASRIELFDWEQIGLDLNQHGCARVSNMLTSDESNALAALFHHDELFRVRIVMAQHGFGQGEYKYFDYPLPDAIAALRATLYSRLVTIANQWNEAMCIETRYPSSHLEFIQRCHQVGQTRPTPLILRYNEGDFNCLHQDLYGSQVFPIQVAILLSDPMQDFTGGEFVMTEQRPRRQSRVEVVPLNKGDAVVFAVASRPVPGTRGGVYRVNMRHGVSRLRSGRRHTIGVIFHDSH